jgi:hypothetical protein
MELRDSGRDLVQIKDDGTHAILPVTSRADVQPDHARVPVMLLRHSDGKMRRDGSNAASMQPNTAVAERGRLHGAPGLAVVEEPRVLARIRGPCRNQERNGEWVRERRLVDRLRRQDKANWRSRAPCDRKGLSAHWFLHLATPSERHRARWRGAALSNFLFDFSSSSDGVRNVRR